MECATCGTPRDLWPVSRPPGFEEETAGSALGKLQDRTVEVSVARPMLRRVESPADGDEGEAVTGISAVAKILKNVIEVELGGERWMAVPLPTRKEKLLRNLSTIFSTHYRVHRVGNPETLSTVYYHPLKDQIVIGAGEDVWVTESRTLGPSRIFYAGVEYTIYETITGKFTIVGADKPVVEGRAKFRSVSMDAYPEEMGIFLANLAIGILIRTLFSELGV
ncbi:MAG: hypothetical protein M1144_06800 [Candidatus Thermoplasmatota archaeon]|jgi:hypothetical protein|nr:hypothetical protein [Candidatus Thermoplasmatota archaeon]MCL5984896.1 hypothetical protein [Candidatus Thermoplasmatota archaeon]